MILCILTSCLDSYTTSVLVKSVIVALYIDCFYLQGTADERSEWPGPAKASCGAVRLEAAMWLHSGHCASGGRSE